MKLAIIAAALAVAVLGALLALELLSTEPAGQQCGYATYMENLRGWPLVCR